MKEGRSSALLENFWTCYIAGVCF